MLIIIVFLMFATESADLFRLIGLLVGLRLPI